MPTFLKKLKYTNNAGFQRAQVLWSCPRKGRAAAGSAADFYGKGDFLNIDSHA